MIIEHLGKKFYVDKRLYEDLEIYVQDVVKADMDFVCVITGEEANGKSKLSRQISLLISYILYKNHNISINPGIDNIYFDLNEYIKDSINDGKYKVQILDESRSLLNRKSSMTRESKRFTNFLSECRKFNQFHILCLPAMHDLDKYCFLWRARYFINVIRSRDENYNVIRGTYIVYPKDKRLIHHYESNYYTYPKFNPKLGGFKGSFPDVESYDDMKSYEAKQKKIMEDKYVVEPSKKDTEKMIVTNLLKKGMSVANVASAINKDKTTIYKWIKTGKIEVDSVY